MKSRSQEMLGKSVAAMLAAIEIYNKPTFSFREEAFSVMAINAWELLLKARILQLDRNRISAIVKYEKRTLGDGTLSEKLYRKKNRSGNHVTIGLFAAYDQLVNKYGDNLNPIIRCNLDALTEIRDNAVHFINKEFHLRKKVHELGSANLKNFLHLVRQWFGRDLSEYQIFLLPMAFLHGISPIQAVVTNEEERRLLNYIHELEKQSDDKISNDFNLSISLDIRLKKVSDESATKVVISSDAGAVPVTIKEEDIRNQYPWDFAILTRQLRARYSDFVENNRYHKVRRVLETDEKFAKPRYLDPGNLRSSKKLFYNPNILKEFDKIYKRITAVSSRDGHVA